ncbi:Holliday junction DNA helicase RuvB [Mycoplasmopsis californica]|uniref:Holliday junction branch migration complex subunit RuvB n=1 Tax=Mycoplasmopsis equigenitalium TaxID=114883 RepID=A0ABY5J1Q4_9BACT|nr:Holliday junction branch migration DNA helicase RuvB [Mycoplasmopsis equigenitalium]UUD37182.1 Holliday junction branch migration DNA helicase RuvB [Mycoplasmopsis equigenitalium]VEU69511.1 Holliday junction DNA helicase RuvB [Mycoplasmopsis californica]
MQQINSFKRFIGQESVKKTIKTMINSKLKQNKTLDHILFYGMPGTGKTTLANIISQQINTKVHYAQGPMLDRKSDIITLFNNIKENDVVFIDEIHGINKNIEELLYSIMQDFKIDIVIGKDANSKMVRINIKPFTLIGATTKLHQIAQPLRDRFGYIAKFQPYNIDDIAQIITNYITDRQLDISDKEIIYIAQFAKYTPRIALNLIERIIDFSVANNTQKITINNIKKYLTIMGIYKYGLNDEHIEYLKVLNEDNKYNYFSLDLIAGITNYDKENILMEIEPILLQLKFIIKTSRGRRITKAGIEYINSFKNI